MNQLVVLARVRSAQVPPALLPRKCRAAQPQAAGCENSGTHTCSRSPRIEFAGLSRWTFQLLYAAAVLAAALAQDANGSGFIATGTMTCVQPDGDRLKSAWTCPFEVAVLGKARKVSLFQTNGQRRIHGSDGVNVYSVLVDPVQEKKLRMPAHVGTVFRGDYPADGTIQTTLPWLAYCSRNYVAGVNRTRAGALDMPAPWMPAWALPLAHIYAARYAPIPGGDGLPHRLEFQPDETAIERLRDGKSPTIAVQSGAQRERTVVQLAYYRKITEPEAVYEVASLTNCAGMTLPGQCSFEMYRFEFGEDTTDKTLAWRVNCALESVVPIDTMEPLPTCEGPIRNVSVADYRFAERTNAVAFLPYTVTNWAWVTNESDPLLQSLLARALAAGRARDSTKPPRALVALVLLALVLAPLLFTGTRRRIAQLPIKLYPQ